MRSLVPPPNPGFSGSFADFYQIHVEPNLPTPEAVSVIHRRLVQYVSDSRNTLFVTRIFDGRRRGKKLPAAAGLELVCGDNEPALWFFARAFLEDYDLRLPSAEEAIASRAFPIGFALNSRAGEDQGFWSKWGKERWEKTSFSGLRLYHAHLFDAADGIPSQFLDRKNLQARMIRFLHPANHFPMPTHHKKKKTPTYSSGGHRVDLSELPGVKRFICERFAERYHDVWPEFLALAEGKSNDFMAVEDLVFECTLEKSDATEAHRTPLAPSPRRWTVQAEPELLVRPEARPSNTYRSANLVFKADVIDGLGLHESFRVETPEGAFEMTRAEFLDVFGNVARSSSYQDEKRYSYPTTPQKAYRFLVKRN